MKLRAQDLQAGYLNPLFPPLSLTMKAGERWVILGRNGAGKSTLLRTLLHLQKRISGDIEVAGRIAYVPQQNAIDDRVPCRVRDLLYGALDEKNSFLKRHKDKNKAHETADKLNLGDIFDERFADLSAGQKQRVLVARALCRDPDVLFLDEPTSAMDLRSQGELVRFLRTLSESGTTIAMVSHHVERAVHFATHAIFIDRERQVSAAGAIDEVTNHPVFMQLFGALFSLVDSEPNSDDKGAENG